MAALTRYHMRRWLRLATPIDATTRTRIAALPGINRASLNHNGNQLLVEYDLHETELQTWLPQARACGVQPVTSWPTRCRHWLAAWRDHNRRRHLLTPAGWHQYLQSAFLVTARSPSRRRNTTSRHSRQHYRNEDGHRTTDPS